MEPSILELTATLIFTVAVLHTFMANQFLKFGDRFYPGSIRYGVFHYLGEVEAIFGIWAGVFLLFILAFYGGGDVVHFIESVNFTEPTFVFVIMIMASTQPLIEFCTTMIIQISKVVPLKYYQRFYFAVLVVGPLLGSFVTEPAAMTLTALILRDFFFDNRVSQKFKYFTLAVLFVNVSIGGVLTHFAAPPVIMVASKWGWGLVHMFTFYGWKAIVAVIVNALVAVWYLDKDLKKSHEQQKGEAVPASFFSWKVVPAQIIMLALVVVNAHHPKVFLAIFLFFLGFVTITKQYQSPLKVKESLLVAFFLAGLVTLGSQQAWWLQPFLSSMTELPLYIGSTLLTAVTDNAALTFLGSQVEGLSDELKYFLVAGAVAGGGLSVIANAPNPAGLSILKDNLGAGGFKPVSLLVYATFPTIVALLAFALLPNL